MFERNKIDNSMQQAAVPAEVTLDDGRLVKGKFLITASRSIFEVLNGEGHFLEFETYDGERTLIARSMLKSVKIVSVPSGSNLKSRVRDGDNFEPHMILGVASDAPWDEIRAAYVKLSKAYHPDRYATADLPHEVRDYLSAMSRRVNAAYAALEVPMQAAKRAVIEKAKPIFTSSQRL
jgi:DnaJ domain